MKTNKNYIIMGIGVLLMVIMTNYASFRVGTGHGRMEKSWELYEDSVSKVPTTPQAVAENNIQHFMLDDTHLLDPESYRPISFNVLQQTDPIKCAEQGKPQYKWSILHVFRAKNGYGGYKIGRWVFFFNDKMNIVGLDKIQVIE